MITLHSLGHRETSQELSISAEQFALNQSNPISAAHLNAAGHGLGSATIHDCLATILTSDTSSIEDTIDAIDNIGNTSG